MINKDEKLEKSIDAMIDELFGEGESLEKAAPEKIAIAEKSTSKGKSIGDDQKPVMNADENGAKKEGEEDEKEGKKRGRPDDLSIGSERKENGDSTGKYDSSITEAAKTPTDDRQVKVRKSVEISEEDYQILQKAKADAAEKAKSEELRKAQEFQSTLIKSAVQEATKDLREENQRLAKSLEETQSLMKSLAKKPQPRKSVSSVQVLEKSFAGHDGSAPKEQGGEAFSKSEMLDAAERLAKSGQLKVEQVIELEDTGFIFDPNARKALERELNKQK